MTEVIRQTVAQNGVLMLAAYIMMIPLVVTALLAGRQAVGNLWR